MEKEPFFVAVSDETLADLRERLARTRWPDEVAFGNVDFTVVDYEHGGTVRIIHNTQTEMFHRNPRMPRGWELVDEQIGYITPLRGDQ
jgi:hypothetical protein